MFQCLASVCEVERNRDKGVGRGTERGIEVLRLVYEGRNVYQLCQLSKNRHTYDNIIVQGLQENRLVRVRLAERFE